ncbi:MAG: LURP-one-related family protein [Ruthenibacterium sp.]
MKLYIKQKVFSIRDKFFVANENAENLYQVTGKIFSLGHKLTVQDMQEKEVVTIHQKVLSFLSKYFIASEGKEVEIERKITQLTREMKEAAKILEFEHAAFLRDRIDKLRKQSERKTKL